MGQLIVFRGLQGVDLPFGVIAEYKNSIGGAADRATLLRESAADAGPPATRSRVRSRARRRRAAATAARCLDFRESLVQIS